MIGSGHRDGAGGLRGVARAAARSDGTPAQTGEQLFTDSSCITCHQDDAQARGPSLMGLFGQPVQLQDGRDGRSPTRTTCASRS